MTSKARSSFANSSARNSPSTSRTQEAFGYSSIVVFVVLVIVAAVAVAVWVVFVAVLFLSLIIEVVEGTCGYMVIMVVALVLATRLRWYWYKKADVTCKLL